MGIVCEAGYLTIVKTVNLEGPIYLLKIPNRELLSEFKSFAAFHLNVNMNVLNDLYQGVLTEKRELFKQSYQSILLANPSYYDLSRENPYAKWCTECHMLLLGICLYIQNDYQVFSNREVGKGRCDIILKALRKNLPSYVLEFTHLCAQGEYAKKEQYEANPSILDEVCIEAIEQIREKRYDIDLKGEIIHVGLAHYSKEVKMMWIQKNEAIGIE